MRIFPKSLLFPAILLAGLLQATGSSLEGAAPAPPQSQQGYIGIGSQNLTQELARERKVPEMKGVLITEVSPQSPAAAAGLKETDVVIEFDGKEIADDASFGSTIRQFPPGKKFVVKFVRGGLIGTTTITVGETPPDVAYLRSGYEKGNHGDLPGAIADYTEAIRLGSRKALAYLSRGMAKANNGDLPGAIADYTEAIRVDPKNATACFYRGMAKTNNGDLPGAIADYTEAIRLDPQSAFAYFNRGFARQNKGDLDGAIVDYNEVIRLDPKNADAYLDRGLAKANRGVQNGRQKLRRSEVAAAQKRSAEAMADHTEANRLYTEAIRLDPNDSLVYEHRAIARDLMGEKGGAAQDRAASARIKEQVAFARFREEVTKASLPDLLAISEQTEANARERNRAIVAAKNQQLPTILRERKTDELSALVVKIEQTILDLNHESEVAKDRAHQATAAGETSGPIDQLRDLSISYRERIELLKPIAAALKDEIANRNR